MATVASLPPRTPPKAPGLTAPKHRRGWPIYIAVAVAALAGIAYSILRPAPAAPYLSVAVDRGDIEAAVTTTGNCNAVVTVQVGSQVSGNIIALYADFNTKVKRGDLVARIDPAIFQARVDQLKAALDTANIAVATARATIKKADLDIATAQANVATQKANVVHAESEVADAKGKNERRIQLVKQGIIDKEDADTAKATYDQAVASLEATQAGLTATAAALDSAKAQREVADTQLASAQAAVKQNQASLAQAQLDLTHTEIRAPVDGTVVSRNMDVGQTVAASFQAPTIFLIAQDLTKMQVDTNVDESDIGTIRVGQNATFSVDAYPSVVFPGMVAQIRQAPINVQNVITYDVVIQVANPDLKLFPGMTANVRIVTNRASDVLRMPVGALRFRPPNVSAVPKQTVYVVDRGLLKAVRVELGISDESRIAVTGGDLKEGDRVATGLAAKTNASPAQPASQGRSGGTRRVGF